MRSYDGKCRLGFALIGEDSKSAFIGRNRGIKHLRLFLIVIFGIGLMSQLSAFAEFAVPNNVIGNGGGKMGNSSFRIVSTLGQPIIGETSNSANIVFAGFWYLQLPKNVTAMSQFNQSRVRFNRRTGEYSFDGTWENTSNDPFSQCLRIIVDNITSPAVTVANPDGTTPAGKPFFDYEGLVGDGKLDPGETSLVKRMVFNNPTRARFELDLIFSAIEVGSGTSLAPPIVSPFIQPPPWEPLPRTSKLFNNFPNPFNPETWIPYQLAKDGHVSLTIYDTTGEVVHTIDVGHKAAAVYRSRDHSIYWDGRNDSGEQVSSGIYFYHLKAGDDFQATKKMIILK